MNVFSYQLQCGIRHFFFLSFAEWESEGRSLKGKTRRRWINGVMEDTKKYDILPEDIQDRNGGTRLRKEKLYTGLGS